MAKTKKLLFITAIFFFCMVFKTSFANAYQEERFVRVSGRGNYDLSLGGVKPINMVNVQGEADENRVGLRWGIALLNGGVQVDYKETLSVARSSCPCWSQLRGFEDSSLKFDNVNADTIRVIKIGGSGYFNAIGYGYIVPDPPGVDIKDELVRPYINGRFSGTTTYTFPDGGAHTIFKFNLYALSDQNRDGGYQLGIELMRGGVVVDSRRVRNGSCGTNQLRYARSSFPQWACGQPWLTGALDYGTAGVVADAIRITRLNGGGNVYRMQYRYNRIIAPPTPPACTADPSCASETCVGRQCHDSCGNTYNGTYNPTCAASGCNLNTCPENTCLTPCGVACPGTMNPVAGNGQCGELSDSPTLTPPDPSSIQLCRIGALVDPPGVVASGAEWQWTCKGICASSTSATCTAKKDMNWKEVEP